MKLHLTATSERGKPVTKSGNEFINIDFSNENRECLYRIHHTPKAITLMKGNKTIFQELIEPKTAREWEKGFCFRCYNKREVAGNINHLCEGCIVKAEV